MKRKANVSSPASYVKHSDNLLETATPNKEKELCKRNLGKQKNMMKSKPFLMAWKNCMIRLMMVHLHLLL